MPDPASSQQTDLSNIATALDPCDPIVHLSVGSNGEIVRVHEGILYKLSEYFKRAMKPEWKNSRSDPDTIDLSEDSKDAVSLYVKWLYSSHVSLPPLNKAPKDGLNWLKYEEICTLLAASYVFGERIIDVRFKNSIL
ncbi:hypothetical protein FB567DRAFT_586438 [Paraphoma chrysanthemicola]|uniref:BTB domain-containing protein n=1 Tax=Paraphoma chrysanthemicola TaxID=798071 RepID=A0A8K0W4P7_9PLEO|nr:hypothetical protein FB567DRAFT_586438 [Paraphoma chrysanthemicola]